MCSDGPTVRFDNGMCLAVASRLAAARRADTILLPPCDDPASVSDAVLSVVRRAHARGARIISLCTGAFVLARTGLLDGRRAVTHWDECERFAAQFPPMAGTLEWMSEHLDRDLTIGELADRAAMSPRSFARHFVATTGATPYQWLLRRRIHEAQRLLERTDLPVEVIAERVGLGNPANLRKHFRRQLDTSPQSYRRTFRSAQPAEPLADVARSKA